MFVPKKNNGPLPGTPAYAALLEQRKAALGLSVVAPSPEPSSSPVLEAPIVAEPPQEEPAPEPTPVWREAREWRGPTGSIWPACHSNPAHRYAYAWDEDEQRYTCLACVSVRSQRQRQREARRLA